MRVALTTEHQTDGKLACTRNHPGHRLDHFGSDHRCDLAEGVITGISLNAGTTTIHDAK
jgi:hypothetical protein